MLSNRRARSLGLVFRNGGAIIALVIASASSAGAQSDPAPPPEQAPPTAPAPSIDPPPIAPTPPSESPPVVAAPAAPFAPPGEPGPPASPPGSQGAREPAPLDAKPEEKDFSHGLELIYFNVEGGYQSVGLRTLHTSNLLPETASTSGSGTFFGLGGGVRLIFLTLGPRFRIGTADSWNTWTLDAEAGIHLPLGHVEPYFTFAAGYAKLTPGAVDVSCCSSLADVTIRGFNARLGMGIDYYASKNFTIGASATAEILALSRSGGLPTTPQAQIASCNSIMDPMQKEQCAMGAVSAADGSSLGMAAAFSAVVGLHF